MPIDILNLYTIIFDISICYEYAQAVGNEGRQRQPVCVGAAMRHITGMEED